MHKASTDGASKPSRNQVNIQKRQRGSLWWISNLKKVSLKLRTK